MIIYLAFWLSEDPYLFAQEQPIHNGKQSLSEENKFSIIKPLNYG